MAHSNTFSLLPFCPVMEKPEPLVAAGHIALEAAAGECAAQRGVTRCFAIVTDKHGIVVVCGFV